MPQNTFWEREDLDSTWTLRVKEGRSVTTTTHARRGHLTLTEWEPGTADPVAKPRRARLGVDEVAMLLLLAASLAAGLACLINSGPA